MWGPVRESGGWGGVGGDGYVLMVQFVGVGLNYILGDPDKGIQPVLHGETNYIVLKGGDWIKSSLYTSNYLLDLQTGMKIMIPPNFTSAM